MNEIKLKVDPSPELQAIVHEAERVMRNNRRSSRRQSNRALLVWVSMLLLICVSVAYHMNKP